MDLRNSNGIESRNFYFTTVNNCIETFFENFHQKWKNASCGAQFRYFQIKKVKGCSMRLKILTYECPIQSYITNRAKLWEQIQFKR